MEVLIIGALVGGVVALIALSAKRSRWTRETWTRTAEALGMSFDAGPHSTRYIHARRHLPEMFGRHDGQELYIGVRSYTTGTGKNRTTHYYTYVDVIFDPALKRGLGVRRADGVSKFFGGIFGQRDVQIGHEQFDRDFRIDGLDPGQVQGLLSRSDILETLQGHYGDFQPSITDGRVRFEARGILVEVDKVEPAIAPAVALHRAVLESWQSLPRSAEETRIDAAWNRVCQRANLSYQARGMRARGRTGDVHARMEVLLSEQMAWSTEIEAVFDPPLAVGLAVTREGAMAGIAKLFGAQDIETGDPSFDRQFVIKGKDAGRVKQILVPDARTGLCELHRLVDELVVSDDSVRVKLNTVADNEDRLFEILSSVTGTAQQMVSHRKVTPAGPYR